MEKKIMIVDDESSIRESVTLLLESENFKVSQSSNADECWEKLKGGEIPDLILLDVMMPGMTPIELIKRIKEDLKLMRIKIIYVTAVMIAKEKVEGLDHVEATVEKPFSNKVLISTINKVLEK